MKIRNGFVSNSSSSSFLIISTEGMDTKEDWKNLFKKHRKLKKKDLSCEQNRTVKEMLDSSAEALFSSLENKEYDNDFYSSEKTLEVYSIYNWKELLENKDSWLYLEIHSEIRKDIIRTFWETDPSSFGGRLQEDIQFELSNDTPYWSKGKTSLDEFMDDCVDIYVRKLLHRLEKYENLYLYLICTSSEKSTEARYSSESWFLRFNWRDILKEEVEFMRFERS